MLYRSPAAVSGKSRWLPPGTKITWLVTHFVLDSEVRKESMQHLSLDAVLNSPQITNEAFRLHANYKYATQWQHTDSPRLTNM